MPQHIGEMRYLQKLGHSYYVRVKVPKSLQATVGNTHVRKALHTRDLDEANALKWSMVRAIKAELMRLRKAGPVDPAEAAAVELREALKQARAEGNEVGVDALEDIAAERAGLIETKSGTKRATTWHQLATSKSGTVNELVDEWLAAADYIEQTKQQHRKAVKELVQWFGGDRPVADVSPDDAADYVEQALKASGQSYATQRRKLNSLGSFWQWLAARRHVPRGVNPWSGFRLAKKNAKGRGEEKRPYTEDELCKLLSGSPDYPHLAQLIVLGLYTGARLDELCSLRRGDVSKARGVWYLDIRKAKTKAGVRTIAVAHPHPAAVLEQLTEEMAAPDAPLFPELRPGGLDGKLSWAVSKAFGRYRTKQGLSGAVDFHSFRRTLITRLENLRVDQVRIARYVGHELPTMAFAVYSGGATEETQRATARAIDYPVKVEKAVQAMLISAWKKSATP